MSSHMGFAYAIGAAVTWGLVYVIDQRILRDASPFALLFIDAVLTMIILLPIVYFERSSFASLSNMPGSMWAYIVLALVLAIAANFFIYSSIQMLGASTASIFEISYPFFVVIFSYFIFRSTPNIYFLIGAALIFAGSAVIILKGHL